VRVTLRLRVNDAVSPRATVTVKIYRGQALSRRTLKLGLRAERTSRSAIAILCRLAVGRYT